MVLNDLVFLAKFGYIITTSNGDVLVNGININDLEPRKWKILVILCDFLLQKSEVRQKWMEMNR